MEKSKIETVLGMCVVTLTKYIMKIQNIGYEAAYKRLLTTELYKLLQDSRTQLILETNEYLCEACRIELMKGKEELYEYINSDDF